MVGLSVYLSVVSTGLSHSSARWMKCAECEDEERFLPSLTSYVSMETAPCAEDALRDKINKKSNKNKKKQETWITLSFSAGSRPFVCPGRRDRSDVKRLLLLNLRPPLLRT